HATFFIEGWNAVHHPDRVVELAQRGHEVALHGWMLEPFAGVSRDEAADAIHKGIRAFARLGLAALGFRAPGGERGPYAEAILAGLGFAYDSSAGEGGGPAPVGTFALEAAMLPSGLAHVPWHEGLVDSIQYLRTNPAPSPRELQARWIRAVDSIAEAGSSTTLVAHAYVSGVDDDRFAALANVLRHARRRGDIAFCTAGAWAARVRNQSARGV
ncbi:MAG: polysaccharide deacetylase family protein, partial [Lautropia sp.]